MAWTLELPFRIKKVIFPYWIAKRLLPRARDGIELSVVGVGTVRIKMYDGVVRTLEVRHVPELRKNLISLSLLDSHGYRYSGEGEVVKVIRGALPAFFSVYLSKESL